MFCGEYIVKRGRERVGKEGRNVGNLPVCLRLFYLWFVLIFVHPHLTLQYLIKILLFVCSHSRFSFLEFEGDVLSQSHITSVNLPSWHSLHLSLSSSFVATVPELIGFQVLVAAASFTKDWNIHLIHICTISQNIFIIHV